MEVAARGSGARLYEQGQVLGLGQEQEQPQPLQEREAGVEDQEPKTCRILYVCLASGHFLVTKVWMSGLGSTQNFTQINLE